MNTLLPPSVWRWMGGVLVALCLLVVVREAAIGYYCVEGSSMKPSLQPGDCLLADKTAFVGTLPLLGSLVPRDGAPFRGDMVLIEARSDRRSYLIKRVIALPHDTLAMRGGGLYVNSKRLVEPYVYPSTGRSGIPQTPGSWHYSHLLPSVRRRRYAPTDTAWGPIVVPDCAYFVLGDNRSESSDSRHFGFVRHRELVAKPIALL